MVFVDDGFERLGSYLSGLSPAHPGYMSFSLGSGTITGSETDAGSEHVRKPVSWNFNSLVQPVFTSLLLTTDANGSFINRISLWDTSSTGTGNMFTIDISAIGSKNNTFDVQVEGTIRFARP